jgi:hypothetical protein
MKTLTEARRETYRGLFSQQIVSVLKNSEEMASFFARAGVKLSEELDCDDTLTVVTLLQEIYVEAVRKTADGLAETAELARKTAFS